MSNVARFGPKTQAVYYRDPEGNQPVKEFVRALKPTAKQVAINFRISLLNGLPPDAPPPEYPVTSQVEGELRELRCKHGRTQYRILYRRTDNLCILLHILEKTTGKIPEADKRVARQRWDDLRRRMEEVPRKPPRAIGSDAP